MLVGFLAGDGEDLEANDDTETEPDQVPPCEATLHLMPTLFTELNELSGIGRPVKETISEARTSIRDCCYLRGEVLE